MASNSNLNKALKKASSELKKIARDMDEMNHIEDQLGETHAGQTPLDTSYEKVETRLRQPHKHDLEWMRGEGMMNTTDESSHDDLPPSYEEVLAEARGLNRKYEMPSSDEYQGMMGRGRQASLVRKSSIKKIQGK